MKLNACFSFAAYAKAVIEELRATGFSVHQGLSKNEFFEIESSYGFEFPPELRAILSEGLPVGPAFPNWRSSSPQPLLRLLRFPVTGILRAVSGGGLWIDSWGEKPARKLDAIAVASAALETARTLVPICRNFYIPAQEREKIAGDPVFYVGIGGNVGLAGFDVADFFLRWGRMPAPAWAARTARRIDVWSDVADTWSDGPIPRGNVNEWLDDVVGGRLRSGGWREEEVKEMLGAGELTPVPKFMPAPEFVPEIFVSSMALTLHRGGWSDKDVVELMG